MEMIRSEEYPAGARLPSEQQLAQRFEVSRNTVRGAIRSLSIFGLLRSINGSGTFVSERANVILEAQALASIMAHPDALLELVQARCVLEPQLAAMAARAASREEIDRLFEIVERMRGVEDHTAQINIGFSFHLELARMAHNRVLLGFYTSSAKQLRDMRLLGFPVPHDYARSTEDHLRIAEAIASRDPDLSQFQLRHHITLCYQSVGGAD
ncbi:MAG: FCD domain-containing protein [Clostridia bacterium]|nr:FCD domain-containing protein [Clostridia bacterium]